MIKYYFICFCASFSLLLSAQSTADRPPNIVILFADDLGYADLGSYGNPYIRTPSLDQMASEGQRWTDFYVAAPVCSPSRGALMTGQVPVRSGLYGKKLHVMFPGDEQGIPDDRLTLPEALKTVGYATGMFGKWHLGDTPDAYPTRHGFDYWYGIPYSNDMDRVGVDYDKRLKSLASRSAQGNDEKSSENGPSKAFRDMIEAYKDPKIENWNVPLYRSTRTDRGFEDTLLERPLDQPRFTRRITEEAIDFIRDNKEQPFLVYLPYSMPHLPLFPGEEFIGTSLRGAYGDTVEEIDWSVAQIRQTLEKLNLDESTLVIFSSDNGPWQSVSTGGAGSAGMFRGAKGETWEGGMRVPGIFWWPGNIQSGVVSDIGNMMDVYATALGLAGVDLPEETDALDLRQTLLDGKASPRNEMPYYKKGVLAAYRMGRYKLSFYADGDIITKLDAPKLYDLHTDLSEKKDIASENPDILKTLLKAVETHRAKTKVAAPIFDIRLD